jgi:hypothetical protein
MDVFLTKEIQHLEGFLTDAEGTIFPATYSHILAKALNAVYIHYLQKEVHQGKTSTWDNKFIKYAKECLEVLEAHKNEEGVPVSWDWANRTDIVMKHPWPLMMPTFMDDMVTNFQEVELGLCEVCAI